MSGDRAVVVTGGAGFIGCNLADRLALRGERVIICDSLARPGVRANLDWLMACHGQAIEPVIADVRDADAMRALAARARAIFHLAGQVAVTTSLDDPMDDFTVNLAGTLAVLEAARTAPARPPVIFASTNKVYGDLADLPLAATPQGHRPARLADAHGIDETRPIDFHTPYGCSKGAADQYVLDYARSFGLATAVLRMSCIYGQRQLGTEDQGWVAHFLIRALGGQPVTLYGDGHQVRDILHVDDAVDAYVAALDRIGEIGGQVFNLGGGPANAVSLRELLDHVGQLLGRPVDIRTAPWRAGDQRWYVTNTARARRALGLAEPVGWREGVARLLGWLRSDAAERAARETARAA